MSDRPDPPVAPEARAALLHEAFRFTSFMHWVNTAHAREWPKNYVSADQKGRICGNGADFQRARDEDAFPVIVYTIAALAALTPPSSPETAGWPKVKMLWLSDDDGDEQLLSMHLNDGWQVIASHHREATPGHHADYAGWHLILARSLPSAHSPAGIKPMVVCVRCSYFGPESHSPPGTCPKCGALVVTMKSKDADADPNGEPTPSPAGTAKDGETR